MAEPTHVQQYGSMLFVLLDDGTKLPAFPTGNKLWIINGTPGEDGGGGGPVDPPTPGDWQWPFPLNQVTSEFQAPDRPNHQGIDFGIGSSNTQGTPIPSAGAGKVIVANNTQDYGGYGNAVVVQHDGAGPNGQTVYIVYGHMASPGPAVSVGDTVTKGQNLGPVGQTGNSFGVHLHFEVRYNSNTTSAAVNPRTFMATKGL